MVISLFLCIIIIVLIIIILIVKKKETFRLPNNEDNDLLLKCFNQKNIDTFKKYYEHADVTNTGDGIVFLTPNNNIEHLPKLSWNGLFLNNFCVDPKKRNKGIGTKLLLKVINKAKQNGKDHIILQVKNSNTKAIKLYKKHGFKKHSEGLNKNKQLFSFYILYL